MNRSNILRNKLYRFFFLLFTFFLFIYLLYSLINGDRGPIAYYKIFKQHTLLNNELNFLEKHNDNLEDKISRLSPDTIDLDYLDEQLRLNAGKILENELVITFDN